MGPRPDSPDHHRQVDPDSAVRVFDAARTARSFASGSVTTLPSRSTIARRISSGMSHASASARDSSRTSRGCGLDRIAPRTPRDRIPQLSFVIQSWIYPSEASGTRKGRILTWHRQLASRTRSDPALGPGEISLRYAYELRQDRRLTRTPFVPFGGATTLPCEIRRFIRSQLFAF